MSNKQIPWLDLSHYNLKMSVVQLNSGSRILVMSDGEHAQKAADALGFEFNSNAGFWVMKGKTFNPKEFYNLLVAAGLNEVKPALLNASEVFLDLRNPQSPSSGNTPPEATEAPHQDPVETTQEQETGATQTTSPRPSIRRERDRNADRDPLEDPNRLITAAMLGVNRLSQEVYEDSSGRFIKGRNDAIIVEKDVGKQTPFLFLRAVDDASLGFCADGLVEELSVGHIVRKSDFNRFMTAIWSEDVSETDERFSKTFAAVQASIARKIQQRESVSSRELFNFSQKLHESGNFFSSLIRQQLSHSYTPLPAPLGVAMQRLLGSGKDFEGKNLKVLNSSSGTLLTNLPSGVQTTVYHDGSSALDEEQLKAVSRLSNNVNLEAGDPDWNADFHIMNLASRSSEIAPEPYKADEISISRADLVNVLQALEERDTGGRSVISLSVGANEGDREELDNTLAWLAKRYAIEGVAEIDPTISSGYSDAEPLRVFSIGEKRPEILKDAPEAALRIREVNDYGSLWTWTSEVSSNRAKIANYYNEQEAKDAIEGNAEENREHNEYQTPYTPASNLGSATTMIPRNLETSTRKALRRITRKYGDIDTWVSNELAIEKEKMAEIFSPEQIDAIALQFYADEQGRGFLIGDQTGIGKGRSLSAMMWRAALQGKKIVFMTERPSNLSDIWRDIVHIGADDGFSPLIMNGNTKVIDEATGEVVLRSPTKRNMDTIIENQTWPEEYNIIFASYGQISRKAEQSEKIQWLINSVDDNTMVVLDEVHNAASRSSNTSLNIEAIKEKAASIVYSSATPAKTSKNMSFFSRLFPDDMDPDKLADIIRKGGETMQEVVANMLASDGVMVRREHDLSTCEFIQVLDEANQERNCTHSDQMSEIFSEMFFLSGEISRRANAVNVQIAQAMEGANNRRQANQMKSMMVNAVSFGSPLTHLSRLFVSALKVDKAVELGLEELRTGGKPVFLVDNTLESLMRDLYDENEEDIIIPDFKHVMHRSLDQLTRIRRRDGEDVDIIEDKQSEWRYSLTEACVSALPKDFLQADDEIDTFEQDFKQIMMEVVDKTISKAESVRNINDEERLSMANARRLVERQIMDLPDDPTKAAPAIRDLIERLPDVPNRMIERIRVMIDNLPDLPASIIDEVKGRIEKEGYTIGEITGRSFECRDGHIIKRARADKVEVKNSFNRGDYDAAIINNSGATGVDMQAGERFLDQRRRAMIEVQASMDVAKQIQAYGRVQRFDQVCSPRIYNIITGLPIEQRFAAMRDQKLKRLSANVTGNRKNAALLKDVPDIMNSIGDNVCTQYGDARPDLMRRLGLNFNDNANDHRNEDNNESQVDNQRFANKFLGRLIMLPVTMQTQVINELVAEFNATVEDLDAKGMNTLKPRELRGQIRERNLSVFEGIPDSNMDISAFHEPVYALSGIEERPVTPIRSDRIMQVMDSGLSQLGPEGPEIFAERLRRNRNRILEPYLPLSFRTVEEALDAGVSSLVNASNRLDNLIGALNDLRIGCKMHFTEFDGTESYGIITKIKTADRGYEHLPGQYSVEMYQPGDSVPLLFTLYSLMNDPSFFIDDGLNGEEYDDLIAQFDGAQDGLKSIKRTILTGNIFKAMSLNSDNGNKLGSVHLYHSMDNGRNMGLVLNNSSANTLSLLPVSLSSPKMVQNTVMESSSVFSTNADRTKSHISIQPMRNRDNVYVLKLPSRRNANWGYVRENEGIQSLIQICNHDRRRGGTVDVYLENEHMVKTATELLHSVGVRFYASGRMREKVNEWKAEEYNTEDVDVHEIEDENINVYAA